MKTKKDRKTLTLKPQNPAELPPLLFAAKSKVDEATLTRLKKAKRIRKIGPRLYTSVSSNQVAQTVRAHWSTLLSELYPESLLSHRTALEYKPSPDGEVVLTSTTNREVHYPGLTLRFVRGPGRRTDDPSFLGLHASSTARALLENLSSTQRTQWRSLSQSELENYLHEVLKAKGEDELNRIRDQARDISKEFEWPQEFIKLDQMIGALLGTKPVDALTHPVSRARGSGQPYDAKRLALFDVLFQALRAQPLKELRDTFSAADHFRNKAFFESYFSNYIEGTTFEIEEAEEIVFDRKIPEKRPKDAHDILGTFELAADLNEMRKTPKDSAELIHLIQQRHLVMMNRRPEAQPGVFKDRPNRAGDTHFVRPDEVLGTLHRGFSRYVDLPPGLPRAIFVMFLIAEVHPFTDGNGRIARLMMNAELQATDLTTIIIPNVYREDYLSALRALTRRERPDPLIRMLARAHSFSYLEYSPYREILEELTRKNWFREPNDAKLVE